MGYCYIIDEDGYPDVRDECIDCKHSYVDELDYGGWYCNLGFDECHYEKEGD